MIDYEETRRFYETTEVWDTDIYGTYTPAYISGFITKALDTLPVDEKTRILNAGSGGKEYYSKGEQHHIDLAGSKLRGIKNAVVGNLTNMPYPDGYLDIVLMAGCVISYCEADKAIRKFYSKDVILSNKTFWSRYAHNQILLAVKEQQHE